MAAHGTSITGDLRMVIRHATSADGLTWDLSEDPVFAANDDPDGLGFAGYAIGVAVSADGTSFERIPADESPTGQAGQVLTWRDVYPDLLRSAGAPTTGGGQPSVAFDDATCTWSLWMTSDPSGAAADQPVVFNNAAGFYRATSDDGLRWHPDFQAPALAWDPEAPGEDLGLLTGADVAFHDGQQRLAYVGFTAADVPAGFYLPVQTWYDAAGYAPGWMVLNGAGD